MKLLFQQIIDFKLVIDLIEVIIWPLTVLTIIIIFRKYVGEVIQRLGSVSADGTGISLTFDKKIAAAKQMLKKIKPKLTSKSAPQILIESTKGKGPYEQVLNIKANLESQLHTIAQSNALDHSTMDSNELIEKLKETGVLNIQNADLIEAIFDLCNAANSKITQHQVNEINMLYKNVQFD